MAQTHTHTDGHGDSMTNSVQRGRVGENCPKICVQEVKKNFNSVINFRRVTHFWLCLLETQVVDYDLNLWGPVCMYIEDIQLNIMAPCLMVQVIEFKGMP